MPRVTNEMLNNAVKLLNEYGRNTYKLYHGPDGIELVRVVGEGISKISYPYTKGQLFEIIQVILAYLRAEEAKA